MWPDRHKQITKTALIDSGLSKRARKLVGDANADSDGKISGGYFYERQHFCFGEGFDGPAAIVVCRKYYERALKGAKYYANEAYARQCRGAKNDAERDFNRSLYFMGRALHCIQDIYAHSNWIILGNPDFWRGQYDARMKLCYATEHGKEKGNVPVLNWLENGKRYGIANSLGLKFGKGLNSIRTAYRASFERIKHSRDEVTHPEMNLDYPGTWASYAYQWSTPGWEEGYTRAAKFASRHSARAFWDTLAELPRKVQQALRAHRVAKKLDWRDMRGKFNSDMGIKAEPHKFINLKFMDVEKAAVSRFLRNATADLAIGSTAVAEDLTFAAMAGVGLPAGQLRRLTPSVANQAANLFGRQPH